jgi:rhamnosyltransferase
MNEFSTEQNLKVSVIIPTLNAEDCLPRLLASLNIQSLQADEIIVIDSSSDDQTIEIAQGEGVRWERIPRELFNHGGARNLAANLAEGNVLIFLSQDVLPANRSFIAEITRPIRDGSVQAVTARQIAAREASPLEVYSRKTNYPADSQFRTIEDVEAMGVFAFYFSNAASAIDRATFDQLGGFSEEVIVNEDMHFCARLLQAGYRVAYQADAVVYHSHDYRLGEQFQRYFDIGVFFSQASKQLGGVKTSGRGVRFAFGQIGYLLERGAWYWIPRSMAESSLKMAGFILGKRSQALPLWLRRACSRQKHYWDRLMQS